MAAPLSTALPLSALLARNAMAAEAARPIRTLFIYHPNGCTPNEFHPAAGVNPTLRAQTMPFTKVKQYCTFLDGFKLVGTGDTHEGGSGKVLTANNAPGGAATSSSIEVVLGGLSPTLFKSLQLGVTASFYSDKSISFNGTTRLPYENSPQQAVKTLFAGAGTGGGGNANADQLRVLDNVNKDLTRLRAQLGTVEKDRLDQHAQSFSILQQRVTALGAGAGTGASCVAPTNFYGALPTDGNNLAKVAELSAAQQDVLVQALACDLVRNVSFMYSHPVSQVKVPGYGIGDHDASHTDNNFTPSKVWFMGQIANLIEKMSMTPDGTGTLLDNTIVLLVSELGHSNAHNHERIPFVLAGGKNTGLVGNRALNFPGANHGDLLTVIAQKAGYNITKFGLATGPMQGIW